MKLWRLEATHVDGGGSFTQFFPIDADHKVVAEVSALEDIGWLCDADRVEVRTDAKTAARLCRCTWPVAELSDLVWWAANPVAKAASDLNEIVDRKKAK